MGEGLNLALGGRRRRRRRRLAVLAALVLLAGGVLVMRERLGPVWAVLSALPGQVDGLLAEHFVPGYTERLRALRGRNAVLHAALAAAAPLEAENEALRSFVEAPARPEQEAWQPVSVIARSPGGGFTLAGEYDPGTPVLDEQGRLAGIICESGDSGSRADPAGQDRGAAAVLAGDCCGVIQRKGDALLITGLPRHSALEAGTVVCTGDGLWVGMLAESPGPDATGLTEEAVLTDTGSSAGSVLFLPAG